MQLVPNIFMWKNVTILHAHESETRFGTRPYRFDHPTR